jgi:hypothetical protein
MKIIKNVCLIIFIIITILFTIGYSSQSIMTASQTISMPPIDGLINSMNATEIFNFNSLLISSNNNPSIDYSKTNDDIKIFFKILFAFCIIITILLSIGIILSYFKLVFISKIILLIPLLMLIILFVLLMIIYLTITLTSIGTNYLSSFIANYINNIVRENKNKIPETNLPDNITPTIDNVIKYNNGFILLTIATCLMFVNHTIYMYFA